MRRGPSSLCTEERGNVVKIDPIDGAPWCGPKIVPGSEYVLAVAEAGGMMYAATAEWDEDLGISAMGMDGSLL